MRRRFMTHNYGAKWVVGPSRLNPIYLPDPLRQMRTMDDAEVILARARQRAIDKKLPYAGALLPAEAFAILQRTPGATLVDIRTQAELYWVGRVPGAVPVEW